MRKNKKEENDYMYSTLEDIMLVMLFNKDVTSIKEATDILLYDLKIDRVDQYVLYNYIIEEEPFIFSIMSLFSLGKFDFYEYKNRSYVIKWLKKQVKKEVKRQIKKM